MGYGYHEGAAFGLFVLFGVLVLILTCGAILPVLAWYLILTLVVVTVLVTVYRCVKRQSMTSPAAQSGISTISNGRNGLVQVVTESTLKKPKKDSPPAYATVTADIPPPSYAALVHTFKTPAAAPVKKSCHI